MIKRLLALGLFYASWVYAQPGHYYVTNYTPSDERIDYVTYGMVQDSRGVLYFANKSGVLTFDGRNWNLITTTGPVYAVAASGGEIYWGGAAGFGKLKQANEELPADDNVLSPKGVSQIFATEAYQQQVYFANSKSIYSYGKDGKVDSLVLAREHGALTGLFKTQRGVYVNASASGLKKIVQGKLAPADIPVPESEHILFISSLEGLGKDLIGTEEGRIYVWSSDELREVPVQDWQFLQRNVLLSGSWAAEGVIALGTLRGGVFFVNERTGATEEIMNYQAGLPDNEIYSLLYDINSGVWVAHDYGFSRIAPFVPFRAYHHYDGLSGNLLCATRHNQNVYVGTTVGLYTLQAAQVTDAYDATSQCGASSYSKARKGVLSILQRKNKDAVREVSESKSMYTDRPAARTLSSFSYQRLAGIDGKVTQVLDAGDLLLAGGTAGVYEIQGQRATPVLSEPCRTIHLSPSLSQLIVSTQSDEIKTFRKTPRGWQETNLLDTLRDEISYIFEDRFENVWLCARTRLYKVEAIDGDIINIDVVPLDNPSADEPIGLALGNDVYAAANGTFNRYSSSLNRFEKYDSLPGPKRYFASAGVFWFYDGHRWRAVNRNARSAVKLEWLSLFQNIRFISAEENSAEMWVITADNQLYKFANAGANDTLTHYPLFLREVRSDESKLPPAKVVEVSQLESTVTFEFIQPDYYGARAVEYRYFVKGISKDWSDWSSNNNIVSFSYLPIGSYTVQVQTRDLMGKVSAVDEISLEVKPPYWKQWWFYAAEAFFFGLLVFLSLRSGSMDARFQFVNRLLSLLTIILLIQFIQTVVASLLDWRDTPVMDFVIQVIIALLVLPLEGYLRRLFVRSNERHLQQQFVKN